MSEVKEQLEEIESVLKATETVVASMQDGDRVQLKELAKTVGLATSMDPKNVLPFVNHFVHNTKIAYVTRGKKGGIIKGVKPVKAVKVKAADTLATDSNS